MATKSHARTAGPAKPAAKPAKSKGRKPEPKPSRVAGSTAKIGASSNAFAARDKKYSEIFGAVFPKGRVFDSAGEAITLQAGAQLDVCFAQYAPTPERMSWVYASHGLSQKAKNKESRLELMLHCRERDASAVRILMNTARYMLESGNPLKPGDLLSSTQIADPGLTGLPHWIVAEPEKSIPEQLDLILLLGVSDAEMQVALKVNPELADGRRVLLEALRVGGVFPVTDSKRTCLTRRRDFHRLWECAFRTVRENPAKAKA